MNPIPTATTDAIKLLQQWLNGVKISQIGHLRAAAFYKRLGRGLGLATTIIIIFIGTSVFSNLSSSENRYFLVLTSVVSVIAAVLAGLQTFLNYPELGGKHQTAGQRYGRLRRRIEEVQVFVKDPEELKQVMQTIRAEWEQLEEESPELPQNFHDLALKIVKPDLAQQRETLENNT